MKEIGGYFQMEQLPGAEYHKNLLRLNLGRTALLYAIQVLGVKTLLLPRFICDSVTSVCEKSGAKLKWYSIGDDFLPKGTSAADALDAATTALPLKQGEYLYLINYYGQLTNETILSLKKQYKNIIVDNTHSFFQRPADGVPTLYSCRKYFGLPDGAYLYLPEEVMNACDCNAASHKAAQRLHASMHDSYHSLPVDSSCARMTHILGRLEHSASDYYSDMLSTASSFYEEPIKRMSPLTRNLLRGIDYEHARERRNENYEVLSALLKTRNPLNLIKTSGPFVYPFYSRNAARLKKELAEHKIFIPTYWNNVINEASAESREWDFASHILPLPVDQRYAKEDMLYVGKTLLEIINHE